MLSSFLPCTHGVTFDVLLREFIGFSHATLRLSVIQDLVLLTQKTLYRMQVFQLVDLDLLITVRKKFLPNIGLSTNPSWQVHLAKARIRDRRSMCLTYIDPESYLSLQNTLHFQTDWLQ